MPFATYESRPVSIGRGDRFLLYTDGVLEATRGEEEFGRARLEKLLANTSGAEAICRSVSNQVNAWSHGVAGDDITVVAVELA
jgi:serine phosphatase RsbU (regulator of sigma subunit)